MIQLALEQLFARKEGIHPFDVRAYILGEHGDSQFLAQSRMSIGGEKIEDSKENLEIFEASKNIGYEVYYKKGYTNFGIAAATNYVVEAILLNAHYTIPLSVMLNDFYGLSDVCLSVPVVLGEKGIERILKPKLSEKEIEALRNSANVMSKSLLDLGLR